MKKMITAAIGGALLSGSLLGAGAANADVYYKNCDAAREAGVTPLYEAIPATRRISTGTTTASPASSRTGGNCMRKLLASIATYRQQTVHRSTKQTICASPASCRTTSSTD